MPPLVFKFAQIKFFSARHECWWNLTLNASLWIDWLLRYVFHLQKNRIFHCFNLLLSTNHFYNEPNSKVLVKWFCFSFLDKPVLAIWLWFLLSFLRIQTTYFGFPRRKKLGRYGFTTRIFRGLTVVAVESRINCVIRSLVQILVIQ